MLGVQVPLSLGLPSSSYFLHLWTLRSNPIGLLTVALTHFYSLSSVPLFKLSLRELSPSHLVTCQIHFFNAKFCSSSPGLPRWPQHGWTSLPSVHLAIRFVSKHSFMCQFFSRIRPKRAELCLIHGSFVLL